MTAGARANVVTAACIAVLSLAAVACGTDAPAPIQAGVVTDTIGDTIVVRTFSGSVWGVDGTLEPEVSIGELDGPEEYLFGRVSSIAVDDERNVYVLDWQAQQILQYDERGDYVRTLTRRGAGPGELDDADQMMFLPDGRLVVRDGGNQRVHLFGPGALERDEWSLVNPHLPGPHRIWTDTTGRTYTFHFDIPPTSMEAM